MTAVVVLISDWSSDVSSSDLREKPGCQGQCPTVKLDSIVFPGVPILTKLVDHALAVMTGIGNSDVHPYGTIAGYEDYFWKSAAPRDSTVFSAKTRYQMGSASCRESGCQ